MKVLIGGTTIIKSSPSFNRFRTDDAFPMHGNFFTDFPELQIDGSWNLVIGWTLVSGDTFLYRYGPFDLDGVTNAWKCFNATFVINGLDGGEYYNYVTRHQLLTKIPL